MFLWLLVFLAVGVIFWFSTLYSFDSEAVSNLVQQFLLLSLVLYGLHFLGLNSDFWPFEVLGIDFGCFT